MPCRPAASFRPCYDSGSTSSNELTIYCGFTLLVNSPYQEFRSFVLHVRHLLPCFFCFAQAGGRWPAGSRTGGPGLTGSKSTSIFLLSLSNESFFASTNQSVIINAAVFQDLRTDTLTGTHSHPSILPVYEDVGPCLNMKY